jgi:hypothetical protein
MIKMSLDPLRARQFFNFMGGIVDEFRLHISKQGWKVAAVDPANVAMATIDLPKENFQNWEFKDDDQWTGSIDGHPTGVQIEEIAVGIDVIKVKEFIPDIFDISKLRSNRSMEELIVANSKLSQNPTNYLSALDDELKPIEFAFVRAPEKYQGMRGSPMYELVLKQGMFTRKILLLHEADIRRNPHIPELPLDYKIQLETLELLRIVKKRATADYIRFGYERGIVPGDDAAKFAMKFIATVEDDDDISTAEKYLERDEFQRLRGFTGDKAGSLLSTDYLHEIVPAIPSETVWVHIGNDVPVVIEFVLGMTGQCKYMQAPRVESE